MAAGKGCTSVCAWTAACDRAGRGSRPGIDSPSSFPRRIRGAASWTRLRRTRRRGHVSDAGRDVRTERARVTKRCDVMRWGRAHASDAGERCTAERAARLGTRRDASPGQRVRLVARLARERRILRPSTHPRRWRLVESFVFLVARTRSLRGDGVDVRERGRGRERRRTRRSRPSHTFRALSRTSRARASPGLDPTPCARTIASSVALEAGRGTSPTTSSETETEETTLVAMPTSSSSLV